MCLIGDILESVSDCCITSISNNTDVRIIFRNVERFRKTFDKFDLLRKVPLVILVDALSSVYYKGNVENDSILYRPNRKTVILALFFLFSLYRHLTVICLSVRLSICLTVFGVCLSVCWSVGPLVPHFFFYFFYFFFHQISLLLHIHAQKRLLTETPTNNALTYNTIIVTSFNTLVTSP